MLHKNEYQFEFAYDSKLHYDIENFCNHSTSQPMESHIPE